MEINHTQNVCKLSESGSIVGSILESEILPYIPENLIPLIREDALLDWYMDFEGSPEQRVAVVPLQNHNSEMNDLVINYEEALKQAKLYTWQDLHEVIIPSMKVEDGKVFFNWNPHSKLQLKKYKLIPVK